MKFLRQQMLLMIGLYGIGLNLKIFRTLLFNFRRVELDFIFIMINYVKGKLHFQVLRNSVILVHTLITSIILLPSISASVMKQGN